MTRWTGVLALCGLLQAAPALAAEFDATDPDDPAEEPAKAEDEPKPKPKKADDRKPAATPAAAPVAPAEKTKPTQKAKDDYEEYGPWKVKVPSEFKGNTFKLRIGDEIIDLAKDEITLKGSDFRERVELIDNGGRVMSSKTIYVDPYIFDFVEKREWRVSLYVGGASVAGQKFRQLLQDKWLQETSLDFEWQPSALGLMVSMATLGSVQEHKPGVTSTYEGSQRRLAATYEWVPMKRSNAFFRKVHFLTYAGVLAAHDSIKITDDLVTIEDSSERGGAFAGNDIMFPLWRFWIDIRVYASFHPIQFKELDFEQKSVQHGTLIGGSYAF